MNGTTRRFGVHRRAGLMHGWFVSSTSPSAADEHAPPDPGNWFFAPALGTAAAVMRAAGRWSLDGVPMRFDAYDWWYRLNFDLPDGMGLHDPVLGFDGLATIARVWLNGVPILDSHNMFLRHECEVGGLLRASGNELLLRFASLDAALAARRPRPRWRAPMVEHQQLRWWRTTTLGRTPGWSPPCAAVGPWRDIWLEDRRGIHFEVIGLDSTVQGSSGMLHIRCEIDGPGGIRTAQLELLRHGRQTATALLPTADRPREWEGRLEAADADLWWPHTHGEPALYKARIHVTPREGEAFSVDLGSIGFRTVHIANDGGDFCVVINKTQVFCRGACWTPIDPVTLRDSSPGYESALAQCRQAGMNMLRVVGAMVYEDDAFFDACDEQGMLVWQDFMFANMDYPADDPDFRASVCAEVAQQAARWRGRPSLALLCGNSEVSQQAAMWGAARETWAQPLFDEVLPALARATLPDATYWPSSAWGGDFPHQVDAGTASYYGVGAYLRPLDDARRSGLRFASECLGISNVPGPDVIARMPGGASIRATHAAWKARAPRDQGAGWDFEDVRDHYLAQLFDVDPVKLRHDDHDRYLMLSRVTSGEVMARTFAEWRRTGSSCRGALVWFLRDLWAGAGWGLLDDGGRPKACWHMLARVLQPLSVLLTDEGGNGLLAHLINETSEAMEARFDVAAWRGDVPTCQASRMLRLAPRSIEPVSLTSMLDQFRDLNHAYRFGALRHDAVVASLRDLGGGLVAQAFHFPHGMNLSADSDLGLKAVASAAPDGAVHLHLRTRRLALAVHVEASGFVVQDEYFHLVPGDDRLVPLLPVDVQKRSWRCTVHALNAASAVAVRAPDGT